MLKIGVVGIGHMGRYHVNTLSTLFDIKFVSVCDQNKDEVDRISSNYGVKGYTDYKKFLSSVDAVIVAVPTNLHYKFASEALEAGKHVLVEKPITRTVYYAEKLIELAQKKKLFLQVGHVERFNAAVQELQNIVSHPYLIQTQRLGPRGRIQDVGVVLDLMIHDIDIVLAIADSSVVSVGAHGHKIYTEYEDVANASVYFESGVVANLTASRVSETKARSLAISQEGAFINLDYGTQDIAIYRQPQSEYLVMKDEIKYKQDSFVERVSVHKDNALKLEQIHFIECIQDQREPIRHPEADVRALKLAKQIQEQIYSHWEKKNA